jgi:hypothetical protein
MLNRCKYSSIQNVQKLNLDQIVLRCINSLCLIHAVSQAKRQKSYLLNSLVLQELIINLSLHSRSTKIIIIPTYIE